MNSNYQWQRQQVDEHFHSRIAEAKSHRLAKQNAPPREPFALRVWRFIRDRFAHHASPRDEQMEERKPKLGMHS